MSDVTQQFNRVVARFDNISRTTYDAIERQMKAIGIYLVGYIRREKLRGQVLQQRSGTLSRNVTASPVRQQGLQFSMDIGVSSESRVPYAGIQERGGQVHIPAYSGRLMRFRAQGSGDLVFTRERRAYVVTLPARPYVAPSVEENIELIRERLGAAVVEGVHAQ